MAAGKLLPYRWSKMLNPKLLPMVTEQFVFQCLEGKCYHSAAVFLLRTILTLNIQSEF